MYGPNGTLNREMAFVMLARAFDLKPQSAGEAAENTTELQPDTTPPAITLTQSPTASTYGSVTVTVTVTDESSVDYIGWSSSSRGASYGDKAGFTDITSVNGFSASSNGWYAVCAVDGAGNYAYKLIQIANIRMSSGGGGGTVTPPAPNGTASNPFIVSNESDLRQVGTGANGWTLTSHYKQTADIILTGGGFEPIGTYLSDAEHPSKAFTGSFDGGGNIITDLTVNVSACAGLFGCVGSDGVVDGVAGFNCGPVTSCYNTGDIMGYNEVGGIVGWNSNEFDTGKITCTQVFGYDGKFCLIRTGRTYRNACGKCGNCAIITLNWN